MQLIYRKNYSKIGKETLLTSEVGKVTYDTSARVDNYFKNIDDDYYYYRLLFMNIVISFPTCNKSYRLCMADFMNLQVYFCTGNAAMIFVMRKNEEEHRMLH